MAHNKRLPPHIAGRLCQYTVASICGSHYSVKPTCCVVFMCIIARIIAVMVELFSMDIGGFHAGSILKSWINQ